MSARRALYKRERAPARKKGVLGRGTPPPNSCLDASPKEVATALYSLGEGADVTVGRAGEYDALRDVYTVVGKCQRTGKAQDFKIEGEYVGAWIKWIRHKFNDGYPLDTMMAALRQQTTGLPGLPPGLVR